MIDMTNFSNNVALNTVVVNNVEFKVNDEVAMAIMTLIQTGSVPVSVTNSTSKARPVSKTTPNTPKAPYVATKDFKPVFQIRQLTSTNGETLFCICRKNGWTKAEKRLMNDSIKALKGIITIDVPYESNRSFKAWGYKTESTAKKHLKELPSLFTTAQLNGEA